MTRFSPIIYLPMLSLSSHRFYDYICAYNVYLNYISYMHMYACIILQPFLTHIVFHNRGL